MKLLGRRCLNLMNWRRRLSPALGASCDILVPFIVLLLMIKTMEKINFSPGRTWDLGLLFPMICDLESKSFWFILDFISTWGGLFYSMIGSECKLASLISFGVMFSLTSYLLVVLLRFRVSKKKRVARRGVRSCVWTRRRVF